MNKQIDALNIQLNRLASMVGVNAHPCDRSEAGHQQKAIKELMDEATERLAFLERI